MQIVVSGNDENGVNDMEEQATNKEWTAQDEADWQALQDDANDEYEQAVCNRYAARDQANLY